MDFRRCAGCSRRQAGAGKTAATIRRSDAWAAPRRRVELRLLDAAIWQKPGCPGPVGHDSRKSAPDRRRGTARLHRCRARHHDGYLGADHDVGRSRHLGSRHSMVSDLGPVAARRPPRAGTNGPADGAVELPPRTSRAASGGAAGSARAVPQHANLSSIGRKRSLCAARGLRTPLVGARRDRRPRAAHRLRKRREPAGRSCDVTRA